MRIIIGIIIVVILAAGGYFAYRHFSTPVPASVEREDAYALSGRLKLDSEASVERGVSFLHQGDIGKALFEFEDAIRIDSNNYRAYYNIGLVYRASGELARAEGYYRTAMAIAPGFQATANNLANLMLMKNAPLDSVLFYINRALAACPDCTDFIDTKLDALVAAGKVSEAKPLWLKAYAKDSTHVGLVKKKPLFDAMRR